MEAKVNKRLSIALTVMAVALGLVVAGCGSGGSSESPQPETQVETPEAKAQGAEGGGGEGGAEGALPTEAESAATGDIPDNQAFLLYADKAAGYTIRYPEGWARTGSGNDVTFKEKANVVHVVVHSGSASTKPGEKRTLTRQSAPDPVTGKRLPLLVDVYEYEHAGKVAVLELSTPEGVDNVDAYRMISESFRWK
jgi:hypothetical protein